MVRNTSEKQKVIDIFSLSWFAPRGGCAKRDVDCVTKLRKGEELVNCDRVRAEVEFLPFPDAFLRGYKDVIREFPRSTLDGDLFLKIKEGIRGRLLESERTFFPLAIGRHVDHMIMNRIGLELAIEEHNLQSTYFYEDLPYSTRKPRRYSLINPDSDRAMLESTLISFPWRKKWNLCATYQSQFRNRTYRRIITYAKRIKLFGPFYERIWRIDNVDYVKKLLESEDAPGTAKGMRLASK